ncbi:MAG TPA: RNA polymerase sigma factor [Ktedonobacteraceae bacterium]|jgi:RNA polymerase sigma-70 factor (ECF subfamily)|nr:RNA polymerase sigma factor [Ktedonobacteraceae bacterium]
MMNTDQTGLRIHLADDLQGGFASLVATYQHQLYAFLLRRLGDPREAEDLVQETFLQAYYSLKRYPAERIQALALRAWLYKIASNVLMNALRRFTSSSVSLETVEEMLEMELEEEATQPERVLEELEIRRELETLIRRLPRQYAETVTLYYFGQLSYQEIAYVLNCSPDTARSYRHRGIQYLRKALRAQSSERGSDQSNHATLF